MNYTKVISDTLYSYFLVKKIDVLHISKNVTLQLERKTFILFDSKYDQTVVNRLVLVQSVRSCCGYY